MKNKSVLSIFASLLRTGSINFACIQLTTRCNARCMDRCNIWVQAPLDMNLSDAKYAIDALAARGFSVAYFTGGETGLYPYLTEVVAYAKQRGFLTSLTTNGTITKETLWNLRKNLDVISVSVDHYDKSKWDQAKHFPGIAQKAINTIYAARALGIKVYAITFLNPTWSTVDVEKAIRFVNDELKVSFTLSYPYISSSESSFVVGGKLSVDNFLPGSNMAALVGKVLEMKRRGFRIANASCYLRDAVKSLSNLTMRYPCRGGQNIISIDCNLDVFPCFKKQKLYNLKDNPALSLPEVDNSFCDNRFCLNNGFKEASLAAKSNFPLALIEELLSNPRFYSTLIF